MGAGCLFPALAADFVNLKFDDGPLDPNALVDHGVGRPYSGSAGNVIPGWEIIYLGQKVETVGFSTSEHGGSLAPVTLWEYQPGLPIGVIGGRSGLSLRIGDPPNNLQIDLVLRQRGEIPANAVTLEIFHTGHGVVRIDGSVVSRFDSDVSFRPTVDVAPYAGKEVTLEFAFYHGQELVFDIVGFTSVPEPSTWALLGLGAVALGIWGRRKVES